MRCGTVPMQVPGCAAVDGRRLKHAEEQALIDSVAARIPTWKAGLLTNTGRVLLARVTLSAIPVHISIACCLSPWAIDQIDKRRCAFLWSGTEATSGGKCKVAWPIVCRPTRLGGLGVIDLRYFGFALRLRWEWLRRAEPSRCWSSLQARQEKQVAAMAAASISVVLGDGTSARLWMDNWAAVGRLCSFAPQLFAAISPAGKKRSVKEGLQQNRWVLDVVGATTRQVLVQYVKVWRVLRSVVLDPLASDRFVWKWSSSGKYSASSAYRAFFHGASELLGAKELWRVRAPPKVKLFSG